MLLEIVSPESQYPTRILTDIDGELLVPAAEFSVRRHDNPNEEKVTGPQVIAAVHGELTITSTSADGGLEIICPSEAVWIPHGESATVSGKGVCFSTTVGLEARLDEG